VATILGKCGRNWQEGQIIFKSCLMILLRFEEMSLHCENIGIVIIIFMELWIAYF